MALAVLRTVYFSRRSIANCRRLHPGPPPAAQPVRSAAGFFVPSCCPPVVTSDPSTRSRTFAPVFAQSHPSSAVVPTFPPCLSGSGASRSVQNTPKHTGGVPPPCLPSPPSSPAPRKKILAIPFASSTLQAHRICKSPPSPKSPLRRPMCRANLISGGPGFARGRQEKRKSGDSESGRVARVVDSAKLRDTARVAHPLPYLLRRPRLLRRLTSRINSDSSAPAGSASAPAQNSSLDRPLVHAVVPLTRPVATCPRSVLVDGPVNPRRPDPNGSAKTTRPPDSVIPQITGPARSAEKKNKKEIRTQAGCPTLPGDQPPPRTLFSQKGSPAVARHPVSVGDVSYGVTCRLASD